MLKIFKTTIRANDGESAYSHDTRYRSTMGYDSATDTINVLVEMVIPPSINLDESLPEDTPTILRDPHTTTTYTVAAQRTFSATDFPMSTDNCKWIVEFDASTTSISDPIDVYEISKKYITGSNSHEDIYRNLNAYRYQTNENLTPLFVLDSFYKSLGFSQATLQFFKEDVSLGILDTILEDPSGEMIEVSPKEYEFWCNFNTRVMVTFEVIDSNGKILSSAYPSVKPSAKAANFVKLTQKRPVDATGINPELNVPNGAPMSGNRFYVKLPASDTFNVRVMFGSKIHNIIDSRPAATFDVEGVNCVVNKTRVFSLYDPENPNIYSQEFVTNHNHPADLMARGFGGVDGLLVQTTGLIPGDYFKVKLNIGEFKSWGELWVEITN